MQAVNIEVTEIRNNTGIISIQAEAGAFPVLVEVGCRGLMTVKFKSTPVKQDFWLEGSVEGGFDFECRYCGSSLAGKFKIPLKMLVKQKIKGSLTWHEDEARQFDEYVVEIGSGVQKIPIITIIREQIVLKYNSAIPGEADEVEKCGICAAKEIPSVPLKNEDGTDPRWDKLKMLLKKK